MKRGSVLRQVLRRVDWIPVADKWCRVSIMGTDLSAEALQKEETKRERVVILMIPGNPGNEGFYADFGEQVIKNLLSRDERAGGSTDRLYLFYTISHLNHVKLTPELDGHSGNMRASDRFLLDAQVQHKLDFIREHLPKATRMYMLGHSIGSYMMLRLLPYIVDDFNIKGALALFPTIERMSQSPNGLRLRRVLAALDTNDWLTKALSFWLDCLPISLKRWLVGINLHGDGIPHCVTDAAAELLNMNVFRNIIHMSNDELDNVNELDDSLLAHKELIHFLYGTTDGWVPLDYGMEMMDRVPSGHVIIDDKKCEHAFVIKDGSIVAAKIVSLIV